MALYANVIPMTRIPKPAQAFTYAVPPELEQSLQVGHIVQIPWRASPAFGIVQSLSTHSDFPNPSVLAGVAETDPSWSKPIIDVLTALADTLHVSWSLMALSFSPTIPKRKASKRPEVKEPPTTPRPSLSVSKSQIEPIRTLAKTLASSGHTFKFRQSGERLLFYRELCASTDKALLFLVPQTSDAIELYEFLRSHFAKETALWDGSVSKHAQWELWQRIKTTRIVVATRSGAFLPCRNLAWIVLDQDDMPEHKQWEAAPHYDARTCASMRARAEGAHLIRTAAVPRVETTDLSALHQSNGSLLPVQSVLHGGKDLLHDSVRERITEMLEAGKSCLIICTHKGGHRLLRCLDCQHRWLCATCNVALYEHQQYLRCPICEQTSAIPYACPSCQSLNIRPFGAGVEKVQAHVKTFVSVPVFTWHSEQDTIPEQSEPHVLVSTPYACKPYLRQDIYQLLLFFHPESVLFQPDYRANETYYHLMQWHRLQFFGPQRNILLQTKIPIENPLQQFVIQDNYTAFFQQEYQTRQQLLYPPHAFIVKYIYKGQDKQEQDAIGRRLSQQHKNLRGPIKQTKPEAVFWVTKVKTLNQARLDNPADSIYNKLVVDINPHHI